MAESEPMEWPFEDATGNSSRQVRASSLPQRSTLQTHEELDEPRLYFAGSRRVETRLPRTYREVLYFARGSTRSEIAKRKKMKSATWPSSAVF